MFAIYCFCSYLWAVGMVSYIYSRQDVLCAASLSFRGHITVCLCYVVYGFSRRLFYVSEAVLVSSPWWLVPPREEAPVC